MGVPFTNIPSNLRVPLFWVEIDNSAAAGGSDNPKSLLIGQKVAAGVATAEVAVQVASVGQARDLFGVGSQLHRMVSKYLANDPFGELWCIPVDDAAGTPATLDVTITGPATGNGTLFLYVGGYLIETAVTDGDTITEMGDNVVLAMAEVEGLPVTISNAVGVLTIDALNDGTLGNDIDVRANYAGLAGGQKYPDGVTMTAGGSDIDGTPSYLASGATDPTLGNAIAEMADEGYDYVCNPWSLTTQADLFETELADRWGPLKQVYGHVFGAKCGTQGTLTTYGNGRNDPHHTTFGVNLYPNPVEEIAAAAMGAIAKAAKIDPARPFQTLPLEGILPPKASDAFTVTEANTLLHDGIATTFVSGGKVRITRCITTYQTDGFSNPDASFLDYNTLATLQYILRFLKSRIEGKYPRHKLVNDGTNFGAGQAVVSPSTIKAELVAGYLQLERLALVENADAFIENLVVERNATDPNRVDVLYPPDLANQLRVVGTLVQFRLQYPDAA